MHIVWDKLGLDWVGQGGWEWLPPNLSNLLGFRYSGIAIWIGPLLRWLGGSQSPLARRNRGQWLTRDCKSQSATKMQMHHKYITNTIQIQNKYKANTRLIQNKYDKDTMQIQCSHPFAWRNRGQWLQELWRDCKSQSQTHIANIYKYLQTDLSQFCPLAFWSQSFMGNCLFSRNAI